MSFCECPEWEPNIVKVNAPLQLAYARNPVAANQYRGVPFRYCPWCGKALKGFFEHQPTSAQETSSARMQELNAKYAGRERIGDQGELTPKMSEQETRERPACDGCGDPATDRCPYCQTTSCDQCSNCEHRSAKSHR